MQGYAMFGLKILLIFFIIYSLIKFYVFFFVKYERRRKLLDSSYNGKNSATKVSDIFLMAMILILLGLLLISGGMEYISFITGLFVGMVLIQLYFHSFSKPLTAEEPPEPPVSPIKLLSYAIEADPKRAWKELVILTIILVWTIYVLLTMGFGL